VLDGYREWLEKAPEEPAVLSDGRRLTYRELDRAANRLAAALRAHQVGPETVVGLCVPRGVDLAVAVLAAVKSGGAYLPLEPEYPIERSRLMLADAGADLVLTTSDVSAATGGGGWGTGVVPIHLDEQRGEVDSDGAWPGGGPDRLLYVIYTSGSTGRPKGIAMQQGPQTILLDWCAHSYDAQPRVLQYFPVTADVAFLELLSTWWLGGLAVIATDRERYDLAALTALIREHRLTKALLPVVMLDRLARHVAANTEPVRTLRELITTGDRLVITTAIRQMCADLPGVRLDNHYGSTEVNVVTAPRLVEPVDEWARHPAIGRPMGQAKIYVLDDHLAPAPVNVPGHIFVGGAPLARGYLGQGALTAGTFLPDPFSNRPGARMYRIGDLGRWRPNGVLEFLGRADFQIKLHGYRIEPGEIEELLQARDDVENAVVVMLGEGEEAMLAAYLVARGTQPEAVALREYLARRLPGYMVPQTVVFLPEFPVTGTGKIDRKRLPAPDNVAPSFVAPRDELEQAIAEVFAESLGLAQVGVDDDFFRLGGHSLLVTQVVYRIRDALEVDLPLRVVFERPTVAALAEQLRHAEAGAV
jgi:amino acid adenylation domain-containing protein